MLDKLTKIPLINELSNEELEQVKRIAVEKNYPKGATIFTEGEETNGVYIVISGLIKISRLNEDGREKNLEILKQGEILGEMTIVNNKYRSATALSLKPSRLLFFPDKSFRQLIENIPSLAFGIIGILSERLRKADLQLEALAFLNARNRVIYYLLQLVKEHGVMSGERIEITLNLSQNEIANFCVTSRQIVNKVFIELKKKKLIERAPKKLIVLDLERLSNLVLS